MNSRCRRVVAVLSLLGVGMLAACGDQLEVVAPTTTVPGSGSGQDGEWSVEPGTTGSTAIVRDQTTVVETTAPSSTTTTAAPVTTQPPSSTSAPPPPAPTAEAASLAFVNQKRAENGQPALQVDPELVAMAQRWAQQIASDKNLRHNPNLGQEAPDHYTTVGENVGQAGSPSTIDTGWWNSPGHRENILRPAFQAVGIAFVRDENGTYWGVQVFAGH